jgi:hypothetical protein
MKIKLDFLQVMGLEGVKSGTKVQVQVKMDKRHFFTSWYVFCLFAMLNYFFISSVGCCRIPLLESEDSIRWDNSFVFDLAEGDISKQVVTGLSVWISISSR